jgi:D-aminoacyl-tRNA deacylase
MTAVAVVYSTADPAGSGSASRLLGMSSWYEKSCPRARHCYVSAELGAYLAGFDEDAIHMDFLDDALDADSYLVLSRHSSKSGRPSLTVHTTGNHGAAELGGRPRELAWSNPRLEGALLRNYAAAARPILTRYWIGLEATHHGPTSLRRPITFVEIGSTEVEWSDPAAQEAMATAVLRTLSSPLPGCRPAAGFGGTHYPERHTRLVLDGDICYGHLLARYALESPDPYVISQAMDRNYGGISGVVVERKSIGSAARGAIVAAAEARGLPVTYI